ncbi:Gufa protein [Thermococcus chitonophagus]|uniref:Gufa protein n=2 Tax=Thermococcus chitonophagus TaxID=54262 RepID=A0A2Z2N4V3_9EURY|nr:Gufa protein [Thermococcus chitonophagus]
MPKAYNCLLELRFSMEGLNLALAGGLFVALTTSLGALLAVFVRRIPSWGIDFSLSFAAGIMLVASFTSLILPGIEESGFLKVSIGIILGVGLIYLLDRYLPHEHLTKGYEGPPSLKEKLRKAWLLALAMIIHNLPEGLAVGTSIAFSSKDGLITALAIGIQDFPEGTAVSLPLAAVQGKRLKPILLGVVSGVAEMVMVVLGYAFFSYFSGFLGYGMGIAGGAMLYVTVKELIPEIYKGETSETIVTLGFLAGFYIMLFLDSTLG